MGKSRSARWTPTWNISGSWNVDQEKFFEKFNKVLSHLKLKAVLLFDRYTSSHKPYCKLYQCV